MKKLLLATVAAVGLAALPGVAHAMLIWDIYQNVNASAPNSPALQATAAGFMAASLSNPATANHIQGISNNDTLALSSGPSNLLNVFLPGDFVLAPASTSPVGLVMSNAANTNTTAIHITEIYTGTPNPLSSLLIHDDGATIPEANGGLGCGAPGPQSVGAGENCVFPTGPGNHTINLYYEESFAAPAVLQVRLPAEPVPEPATLALLGSALVGFGVWRRRRRTS